MFLLLRSKFVIRNGYSEPFPVTNLPVYFINCEQPGVSEQFCNDHKVPYYHIWLYFPICYGLSEISTLHICNCLFLNINSFQRWKKNHTQHFHEFIDNFFSDRQMRASTLVFEPTKPDLLTLKLGFPFWSELKLFNLQWIPKWF